MKKFISLALVTFTTYAVSLQKPSAGGPLTVPPQAGNEAPGLTDAPEGNGAAIPTIGSTHTTF